MRPAVAAFDFDGTITRGDSLIPFLWGHLGAWRFARAIALSMPWLVGYALRLLSNDVAKARLLRSAWAGQSEPELRAFATQWARHALPRTLDPWHMERIAWHRSQGHCCVIVSASPDVYLDAATRFLGLDDLICTRMEIANGSDTQPYLTGAMASPNCHGPEKVRRLNGWLAGRFPGATDLELYAYGDSPSDKPLLRMAQHAWYRKAPWPLAEGVKGGG